MAAFAPAYYSVSPHVADLERENPALRQAAALALAPMLLALEVVGAAEPGSEAGVAAYGALALALVAAIYAAAPAAGAWCLARRAAPLLRGGGTGHAAVSHPAHAPRTAARLAPPADQPNGASYGRPSQGGRVGAVRRR